MINININISKTIRILICTWIFIVLTITLLLIPYENGAQAQQTIISEDTTWILTNSPYILTGNVLVEQGVTLTIEPGVVIKFDGFYYMQIEGKLIADGSENNMITFTSNNDSPASRDWNKIKFMNNIESGSSINYCKIEYAYTAINLDNIIYNTAPNITNCIIQYNYWSGIEYYTYGNSSLESSKQISNNTILNTSDGYGMDIDFNAYSINASLLVSNNIMKYNEGNVISSHSEQGKMIITHNELVDNNGPGIVCHGTNVIIEYNLIANNECPGIGVSGAEGDSYLIEHNTIFNNIDQNQQDDAAIDFNQHEVMTNILCRSNNIYNNSPYNMGNRREIDINVANNWWGTIESEIIDQNIFDYHDDFNRGKINYTPFLTEPNPEAPDPSEYLNEPPFAPTIPLGHTSLLVNCSYTYATSAEDPEGNQIKYGWDWDGDGTVDEWSDYMASGYIDAKHYMWTKTGTYNVKVKAVDEHGGESEWSEDLEVKVEIVYAESDVDENNDVFISIIFIVIIIIIVIIVVVVYKIKRK